MIPAPGVLLRPRPLLLGLAGIITAATLALEVLLTRLLSVLTWYSLAFLVIGMGLFGLTVGAVEVYFHPERYTPERLAGSLADRAFEAAIAMPVSYALLLVVPLRVESVATTAVLFLVFSAILAVPFVFAGAAVSATLTRSGLPVGRLYAVDLVGAAVGAPLVPAVLDVLDAGSAIVLTGAVAAAASVGFARAGGDARRGRRGLGTAVALAALALANGATSGGSCRCGSRGTPRIDPRSTTRSGTVTRASPSPRRCWCPRSSGAGAAGARRPWCGSGGSASTATPGRRSTGSTIRPRSTSSRAT